MNTFSAILIAVSTLWVASEVGLAVLRRSGPGTTRQDSGSLIALNTVIYASVALGMYLAATGRGRVAIPEAAFWLALLAIALGLAIRWWAVLTLRSLFTVDVAIHAGHRLVQTGPYRYVRHPAYTGALTSFAGLALCSSSWLSMLIILIPITIAFLYRIRIEERALVSAFPVEYREYCARTPRLFPGLY